MFVFFYFYFSYQDDTEKAIKLTSRERRFIKFSSVEYDGQLYMTPQDFLDSVVEQEPRRMLYVCINQNSLELIKCDFVKKKISARLKRRILTMDDINKLKDATPQLKKGSSKMFRNLRDKGNELYYRLSFELLKCLHLF